MNLISIINRHLLVMVLVTATGTSEAATVSISPPITTVAFGATFTLDVVGSGFTNSLDGGGIDIEYDASILKLMQVNLDGFWDPTFSSAGSIDDTTGKLSGVQFGSFSNAPADFSVATLVFRALTPGISALTLSENLSLGGFARLGVSLPVTFVGGRVEISAVPLPSALWVFVSAVVALGVIRRR
jgi:hypothetical protein